MPHIVIEYSDNLENAVKQSGLSRLAHKTVTDSGLFSPEAVKTRSICYKDYVLPEGAGNFLHITVSILTGRTVPQRQMLSEAVFNTAKTALRDVDKLSVDIHEMVKECYNKGDF